MKGICQPIYQIIDPFGDFKEGNNFHQNLEIQLTLPLIKRTNNLQKSIWGGWFVCLLLSRQLCRILDSSDLSCSYPLCIRGLQNRAGGLFCHSTMQEKVKKHSYRQI